MGADLNIKNRQQLTPLCLAAKLTRIKVKKFLKIVFFDRKRFPLFLIKLCLIDLQMFFHILNLQREVYWQFCETAFVSYPVDEIDSIDVHTGRVSNQSALSLVVFGVS